MTAMHPAAPHHLPAFITAPGETDPFMVGSAIGLVVMVFALGSLYFRLHALPEHLGHRNASKLQFEVIGALALLALFTHNNWFWVTALLLALVPIPDLYAPLAGMAESLAAMAGRRRPVAGPDDGSGAQLQPAPLPPAASGPAPAASPAQPEPAPMTRPDDNDRQAGQTSA